MHCRLGVVETREHNGVLILSFPSESDFVYLETAPFMKRSARNSGNPLRQLSGHFAKQILPKDSFALSKYWRKLAIHFPALLRPTSISCPTTSISEEALVKG